MSRHSDTLPQERKKRIEQMEYLIAQSGQGLLDAQVEVKYAPWVATWERFDLMLERQEIIIGLLEDLLGRESAVKKGAIKKPAAKKKTTKKKSPAKKKTAKKKSAAKKKKTGKKAPAKKKTTKTTGKKTTKKKGGARKGAKGKGKKK